MKTTIFLATVMVSALLFVSATVWEGVTDVETAGDKPGNFSIATNAFPRNTVVDITNLENGKKVRVRVVSVLETNGLLATLSRNAAESIDLRNNATCRIRMTQPADDIAFAHFKLGPITPLDKAVTAADAETQSLAAVTAAEPVTETPAAVAIAEPAAEIPATENPTAVAIAEPVRETPTTETPAMTVIAEPEAFAYTETVTDTYTETVSDNAIASADGEPFTETVTETVTTTTITMTAAQTVTEPIVAHNVTQTPETVAPLAAVSAVGAEPAAEPEMVPPSVIELVAQPVPPAAEQTVVQQVWTEPAPARQSRTTATQTTAAPASPANVKILPSEERLPASNQVAIDPQYIVPPIKAEPKAQETTRPAAVATTPAVVTPTTPAYTAAQTQFSPFQVPLISRLEPNKWYVQVGVYTRPEYVEDEINRIGSGYPLAIQNVGTDTNPLFRVLLGPLNQGESSAMLKRFQSIGYSDAFVRYN